jgi:integrase
MARLFKRPGDDTWWIDYVDGAGVRHRKKTNTASRRVAEDQLAEVRAAATRVKLGLDVAPVTTDVKTIGAAWCKWLDDFCPPASLETERSRYRANVVGSWVAKLKLAEVTGEHLDRWFREVSTEKSPQMANALRAKLRTVYNALEKKGLYRGGNPTRATSPLETPEYPYQLLNADELQRVLSFVAPYWRDMVHLAFVTGLRRGELFALRKDRSVVDLERAMLTPRGSNARPYTKGKRVRSIPLTPEAVEVLRRAWDEAEPGALLFPAKDGKSIRSRHSKTSRMVRAAMARAGLVENWLHVCRWGCEVEVPAGDEQTRPCPSCGRVLWPKAVVRHVRFHDLRHSTADHLLEHGVELADVSQMLRHSDIAITNKTYRHRTVEALRKAITKPAPGSLERHLDALAQGQEGEVAEVLREAQKKLALVRHQTSNVVPILEAKKR